MKGVKIVVRQGQLNKLNWPAIFAAAKYYSDVIWDNNATTYNRQEWMLENWGVDHREESIDIVDEAKYMMMVLRFG